MSKSHSVKKSHSEAKRVLSREFARKYRLTQKAKALALEARLAALRNENEKLKSFLRDNFEASVFSNFEATSEGTGYAVADESIDLCDRCLDLLVDNIDCSSKDV